MKYKHDYESEVAAVEVNKETGIYECLPLEFGQATGRGSGENRREEIRSLGKSVVCISKMFQNCVEQCIV